MWSEIISDQGVLTSDSSMKPDFWMPPDSWTTPDSDSLMKPSSTMVNDYEENYEKCDLIGKFLDFFLEFENEEIDTASLEAVRN